MTQPNNECKQVYTGHTLDRSIYITSEIGDLVPLVSFKIALGACSVTHDLSPHAAEAFANMLIAAANATKGPIVSEASIRRLFAEREAQDPTPALTGKDGSAAS